MLTSFRPTPKQQQAFELIASNALHVMLEGGSRSGKTFIALRAVAIRALSAPNSRHAVLRFRFNHVKASVIYDTWPKMMRLCFPGVEYDLDKSDWFARFSNGATVWFAGLDDKDRTEKILGQEYATLYFNEASQIPFASRSIAITRLAQNCPYQIGDKQGTLRLKALYDYNPPSKSHWGYKLFHLKRDPDTNEPLRDPDNYVRLAMNPEDNRANLPAEYFEALNNLPARMRLRFLEGKYSDNSDSALWTLETIEKWRSDELPDMQRMVIAVDPSGSGDTDNAANDEIGIIVAGLGTDGNAYVLEDLSVKAGPATWGRIATDAYERHHADIVVAETNFGGDMVRHVIQTHKKVPFKKLSASRGKVVRAEPISALSERGKIRFAGSFPKLEDELCGFSTLGYLGDESPNRADAFVWAMSELFPGLVKEEKKPKQSMPMIMPTANGWMG